MANLNKIQLDAIKSRSEHGFANNDDCLELLEHLETLAGDVDVNGSLMQRMADNVRQFVDVDFDVSVNKHLLKTFLMESK